MITIDSLTVRYGPQTVLDNLTMHLSERSVHGLVGVNGAGKTTLFDTFFGLVTPDSGSITRSGHPLRRSEIAYLESETFFYDGMTGRDLLDLTAHYNPSSDPAPYVRVFGLPVDRPVAGWSAGMKRKLALTVTLMQQKPLLLLDDLFDKLDAGRVEQLIRLVSDETFGQILITDCNPTRLKAILDRAGSEYVAYTVENGTTRQ